MNQCIRISDVSIIIDDKPILQHVNLNVREGELVYIVGAVEKAACSKRCMPKWTMRKVL